MCSPAKHRANARVEERKKGMAEQGSTLDTVSSWRSVGVEMSVEVDLDAGKDPGNARHLVDLKHCPSLCKHVWVPHCHQAQCPSVSATGGTDHRNSYTPFPRSERPRIGPASAALPSKMSP